jgi:glutathione synthase/RimK-type ligase-like ATP-grasp enzyme
LALATCSEVAELDPEGRLLLAACREAGIETEAVVWNDPAIDWDRYALVLIRSTWDYQRHARSFAEWAGAIGDRLRNRPEVVEWNISKRYLEALEGWGFPVVPTSYIDPAEQPRLPEDGEFVLKPAVSAGSKDTARYVADDPDDRERALGHATDLLAAGRDVLVQPFLASVETEAETAVIVLDGEPVHAMRKASLLERGQGLEQGLFRQEEMEPRDAAPEELELAAAVIERFGDEVAAPLYARVDLLRDTGGEPLILELELIEPSLFLDHHAPSLRRLVGLLREELSRAGR